MFTHRLYNLIVAAVFVVVIALAVQQALTTKAIVPEANSAHTESSEQSVHEEQHGVTPQEYATNSSYRSPLDECFDVSLREAASCRKASQAPVGLYRPPREVCFDVPLGGAVTCPIEGPTLVPSYRSPLDECFDVSLREVTDCRNASQASAP
jgi:hypothetical protein